MATFTLLAWLTLREIPIAPKVTHATALRLRPPAALGLATVAVQIALGGWVSSNYAALACIDFPTCHGGWVPRMDLEHGFQVVRELGKTAAGTHLAYEALTAIHWVHRVGALITLVIVGTLAVALLRQPGLRRYGTVLGVVLVLQLALGVTNVLAGLPLAVAVAHNAGAALLLLTLVVLNFALSRVPSRSPA
jgi:cytochrome c oxidase assembly protein subunit 15